MRLIVNWLVLLASLFCWQTVLGDETGKMRGITAAHNSIRQAEGLPDLVWSDDVALSAQQWADQLALEKGCKMQHRLSIDASYKYGENLYWASARQWSDGTVEVQQLTPEKVVLSWASEKKNYSYGSNSCRRGKECGHYTQIVWKQTKIVGCGHAVCEDKSQVWVCNYDPPGNKIGQRPF